MMSPSSSESESCSNFGGMPLSNWSCLLGSGTGVLTVSFSFFFFFFSASYLVSSLSLTGPKTTLSPSDPVLPRSPCSPSQTTSNSPEVIPPYTITSGSSSSRRSWNNSGQESQERAGRLLHLAYLREVLPKFNKVRRI